MPSGAVNIICKEHQIICYLPLTNPTGKVRVKRYLDESGDLVPVAVRNDSFEFEENDYLEWQISYFDKEKRLVEVGLMLSCAYKIGILKRNELEELLSELEKIEDSELFDQSFAITKNATNKVYLNSFKVIYRVTPILRKELSDGCFLEIELKHKQRAVGYQPMLYLFIPIKATISQETNTSPLGRNAHKNEIVMWKPPKKIILEVIRSFGIMSRSHKQDIIQILNKLLEDGRI